MKLLDILLVDDNRDDCGFFAVAVDKTGLNIFLQTVTDGAQAIDYLEGRGVFANRLTHPMPDLVLLDLDPRQTGGLGLLDWRRASAFLSALPVVLFSDFAYQTAIDRAMAMGATAFITKPVEFERWEEVVRRIWDLGMERSQAKKPALAVGG